jgi:hypothetical protein
MQFIFFVPPNEELEGTLHPQKFGCTHKNEGKRVHVPPDEKTCGHTASHIILYMNKIDVGYKKGPVPRSALIFLFLLSAKPEIVVPESDSGISFSVE